MYDIFIYLYIHVYLHTNMYTCWHLYTGNDDHARRLRDWGGADQKSDDWKIQCFYFWWLSRFANSTLQHTATHYNTLRHNTLQHSATYCHTTTHWYFHFQLLSRFANSTEQHAETRGNTRKHTVTHCNTLMLSLPVAIECREQHPATHGNTQKHAASHCNTLQHNATHYTTLQHAAAYRCFHLRWLWSKTLQHAATRCNTLQHTATHCNTLEVRESCRTCKCVKDVWQMCQSYTEHRCVSQHTATCCNTLQHTAQHWRFASHAAHAGLSLIVHTEDRRVSRMCVPDVWQMCDRCVTDVWQMCDRCVSRCNTLQHTAHGRHDWMTQKTLLNIIGGSRVRSHMQVCHTSEYRVCRVQCVAARCSVLQCVAVCGSMNIVSSVCMRHVTQNWAM